MEIANMRHTPNNPCDGGNACTTGDKCTGEAKCEGTPVVCTAPDRFYDSKCNLAIGICVVTKNPDTHGHTMCGSICDIASIQINTECSCGNI